MLTCNPLSIAILLGCGILIGMTLGIFISDVFFSVIEKHKENKKIREFEDWCQQRNAEGPVVCIDGSDGELKITIDDEEIYRSHE